MFIVSVISEYAKPFYGGYIANSNMYTFTDQEQAERFASEHRNNGEFIKITEA